MTKEPNTHKFLDRDRTLLKIVTDRPMLVATDSGDTAVFYLMTREGNPNVGLIRDLIVALSDMLPAYTPQEVLADLPVEQQLKLLSESRDHYAAEAVASSPAPPPSWGPCWPPRSPDG